MLSPSISGTAHAQFAEGFTPHRPVATHQDGGTTQELRKTNELLSQLVQQMKKTEQRVTALEEKESMSSCSSSSTNSRGKRKKDIPIAVKVSCLCESSWTEWGGGGATSLSSPPFGKYFGNLAHVYRFHTERGEESV